MDGQSVQGGAGVAKYYVKDAAGSYAGEIRSTPDLEQGAINAAGSVLGFGLGIALRAIFASKLTFGIALFIIGIFVGGGWGILLALVGAGFGGWWAYRRFVTEPALINAALLRQPPTEPKLALQPGESELLRFWTKTSNKGVVTNQRIVYLHNDGRLTQMPISAVLSVGTEKRSRTEYALHIQNQHTGDDPITFSTETEMMRAADAVKSAMLGAG